MTTASIVHGSFLDQYDIGKFDAVVMNPPYDKNKWQTFTNSALQLLAPDAELYAVLPQRDTALPYTNSTVLTAPFKFEGKQQGRQQVAVVLKLTTSSCFDPQLAQRTQTPLLLPNLQLTRISNRYKYNVKPYPCIVFPQLVATNRFSQNMDVNTEPLSFERVGDGALFLLTSNDPNQIAPLYTFSNCLRLGGMKRIMERRAAQRTAINKLTGRGTYVEEDLIPWLNEAWQTSILLPPQQPT